ncbi:MAG: hypothetical protein G8345_19380 [Magnetococcales bacterium]|nr:hypothetical protein [Magnetococcales bacterium]NGZ29039.1 hypothetical protein [Magnetococcales bacterium]
MKSTRLLFCTLSLALTLQLSSAAPPAAAHKAAGATNDPCGPPLQIGARVKSIPKDPRTQQNCAATNPAAAPTKIPANQATRPGLNPNTPGGMKYTIRGQR